MVGGGRRDEQRRTAQQRHTHERHVRTQRERHQRVRAPRGGERGHGVVQRGATVVVRALPPDGVPAAQRGEHAQHGAVVAAPCSPRRAHKPRRLSQVVETSHPTECGLSQRRGESRVFSWVTLMLLAIDAERERGDFGAVGVGGGQLTVPDEVAEEASATTM
jgi:hypothetical protein